MRETLTARLPEHIKSVRTSAGVSQEQAANALDISQASYSRIESGHRTIKGHELIILADLFGVRVAALTNLPPLYEQGVFAARTSGGSSSMAPLKQHLCEYLELDTYLTDMGFPRT